MPPQPGDPSLVEIMIFTGIVGGAFWILKWLGILTWAFFWHIGSAISKAWNARPGGEDRARKRAAEDYRARIESARGKLSSAVARKEVQTEYRLKREKNGASDHDLAQTIEREEFASGEIKQLEDEIAGYQAELRQLLEFDEVPQSA